MNPERINSPSVINFTLLAVKTEALSSSRMDLLIYVDGMCDRIVELDPNMRTILYELESREPSQMQRRSSSNCASQKQLISWRFFLGTGRR